MLPFIPAVSRNINIFYLNYSSIYAKKYKNKTKVESVELGRSLKSMLCTKRCRTIKANKMHEGVPPPPARNRVKQV